MTYINSNNPLYGQHATYRTRSTASAGEISPEQEEKASQTTASSTNQAEASKKSTPVFSSLLSKGTLSDVFEHARFLQASNHQSAKLDYSSAQGSSIVELDTAPDIIHLTLGDRPEKKIAEYQEEYDAFMEKATSYYNKLKDMDTYGALDIQVTSFGATVKLDENAFNALSHKEQKLAIEDRELAKQRVKEINKEFLPTVREAMPYLTALAEKDYTTSTGIDRDNLETPEEHTEFNQRIQHYARRNFGINAPSYQEVDKAAVHGYWVGYATEGPIPDGYKPPEKVLPDMG